MTVRNTWFNTKEIGLCIILCCIQQQMLTIELIHLTYGCGCVHFSYGVLFLPSCSFIYACPLHYATLTFIFTFSLYTC